jgi:hypothetical protein
VAAGCRQSLHIEFSKPGDSIWVLTSVEPEIDARSAISPVEPVSSNYAPIGAQVFAIERRNHSKTGVYEDFCVRVPVDTTIAVDKIKKAEKGFKFERFDVFIQLFESSWGQQGSKDKIEPEASRMDDLSFDSASPNRSLCSPKETQQIAAGPPHPCWVEFLFLPSEIHRGMRNLPEFQTFSLSSPLNGKPGLPRSYAFRSSRSRSVPISRGLESKDSGALYYPVQNPVQNPAQNVHTEGGHVLWPGRHSVTSNAAHRLQYGLAVSRDDCSSPQKPAGRGNEETAQ